MALRSVQQLIQLQAHLFAQCLPDQCCSQKCAALRVQSVGVGWLSTHRVIDKKAIAVNRGRGVSCVVMSIS